MTDRTLSPGTEAIRPSNENALVEGEKFTTAWLNIDKFPGGMMMSSHGGRFGPVPAMTGCLITTSATTVEEWRLKGMSVIEVQLRNAHETFVQRSQAATDVLAERHRQVTAEGWDRDHDDEHSDGALARAAACYAVGIKWLKMPVENTPYDACVWPFDAEWWKPKDTRRNLVRSAALILAEIERLDRKAPPANSKCGCGDPACNGSGEPPATWANAQKAEVGETLPDTLVRWMSHDTWRCRCKSPGNINIKLCNYCGGCGTHRPAMSENDGRT
jgi:hypothetical protein